ncbi:nitrile hydratase subunit beta [Pseudonocardia sp. N23]|uniref:nitrile hydratase subunit beta n=1 Tax=Pseudonocardia sp. N23 TaxID=1987376 RepID=UPI000BFE548F|nr:nitrile hydratase subunit beta [Pseudonocardia sp. N23]GAY09470.1 cobalt-containing nitrile hydratase subunit alpha [Pseudonocardia sp. N23]
MSESTVAARAAALEEVLVEKGYVDPAALKEIISTYEHDVGPRNGARVVVRAWTDPGYRQRLLADATPAIAELGHGGRQGEHMVALENTEYLTSSYYAIWLRGLEDLLVAHGLVARDELAAGRANTPGEPARVLRAADVAATLAAGTPYTREVATPARFAVGDRVRARTMHPRGHTRLPRYARGHVGTVVAVRGAHVLPDRNAHGAGEAPEWLYTLRFEAHELWGEDADPASTVDVDAWESYFDPSTGP